MKNQAITKVNYSKTFTKVSSVTGMLAQGKRKSRQAFLRTLTESVLAGIAWNG